MKAAALGMQNDPPVPSERFATTRWALVNAAGADDPDADALESLCKIYWRPIYGYLRRLGRSCHDAQDITQEYFALLLRREFFARVTPSSGRLRTFLLVSLRNYLRNRDRDQRAAKRGGGVLEVSLEEFADEDALAARQPASEAESGYERRWAELIFARAVERLGEEYIDRRRREEFLLLRPYLSAELEPAVPRALEAATRLGLSPAGLVSAVHRLRQRFREALRAEVADTVADDSEVDEELRYLRRSLSS